MIDVRTMFIAMGACSLIIAMALSAVESGRQGETGLRQWASGWAVQGAFWILVGLRGIVWDFTSIVIANTCFTASYSLFYAALCKFQDRPISRGVLFLPSVATFLFFWYFSVYAENVLYRTVFVSALTILQAGTLALLLFRETPVRERRSYWLTGIAFMLAGLIMAVRLTEALVLPYGRISLLTSTVFRNATTLMQLGVVILSSVGFVLMTRGRAERTLAESEQRWAATLASIGDAVIATDVHGNVTFINGAAEALTGWSRSEAFQKPARNVFKVVNEHARGYIEDPVAKVLREEAIGRTDDTLLVRKDGTEAPVHESGAPIRGADGETTGVVVVFRDISERKQAERVLQESEEKYRSLFENLNSAALVIEPVLDGDGRLLDFRYMMANPSVEKHLGKTPDEFVGRFFSEVFSHAGRNPVFDLYEKVLHSGEPFKGEVFLPATNKYFDMAIYRPVPGRLALVLSDVSDRKQAEKALHKAYDELELRIEERTADLEKERRRLYDVLETLPVIVDIIRPDHRIEWANRAFREALGDITGHLCYKSQFGRDKPCDECEAFIPLETGRPHHWEWTLPNGRTFDIHNFPFVDTDGSTLILEMDIDITEQRRMEDQLRQAQKMEALGTLTGGIAHDFNNILAAILGFAELSLDDVKQGTLLEQNLRNILKSSFRARDLIRQMLTFSRKTDYEVAPMSLTPLVKETAKLLRASIPTTINIEVRSIATSDAILANATAMQQVIMNLATNAAYAMKGNGGTLTITLADANPEPNLGLAPGSYLQLSVRDTGAGMDADVMQKVFEPFFTTKEVGQGTGMGLAVVYGIVKGLKGDITVESAAGEGSVFRVILPKTEAGETSELIGSALVPTGNERILFVDDEELIMELGKGMLERLGYMVTAVTSSASALKLFSENPSRFDLVITDQTMPELTGMRLASELFKIRTGTTIILCTGHSDSVNPETAKAAGIRDFLMKPLSKRELAVAVRRALDSKGVI